MEGDLENIKKQLAEQNEKIEKIYSSVEKTRKYFLWTLIISVIVIILPLIGILFLLPKTIEALKMGI